MNRNGKCNCIRERSGLSGSRVWINANFSFFLSCFLSFFFLSSSRVVSCRVVSSRPVPCRCVLFLFFLVNPKCGGGELFILVIE